MKLPRVRFTVRRMMIAVAVSTVFVFAFCRIWPAVWRYRHHARFELEWQATLDNARVAARSMDNYSWMVGRLVKWEAQQVTYHAQAKLAYRRAILRFWEPIVLPPEPDELPPPLPDAPDPPEP
ncbi:MAG TPA: hypothetical protein VGH33_06470 [Isosphaeraceae bacterium]|jgi:hypothetical protein